MHNVPDYIAIGVLIAFGLAAGGRSLAALPMIEAAGNGVWALSRTGIFSTPKLFTDWGCV
jgi:hypothetical protein